MGRFIYYFLLFLLLVSCNESSNEEGEIVKTKNFNFKKSLVLSNGEGIYSASDIGVDRESNIYVLDQELNQIKVFNRNGKLIKEAGQEGKGPGEFLRAKSIFILDNDLFVFDTDLKRMSIFSIADSLKLSKTISMPTQSKSKKILTEVFPVAKNKFLGIFSPVFNNDNLNKKMNAELNFITDKNDVSLTKIRSIRDKQRMVNKSDWGYSVSAMPFGRESIVRVGPSGQIFYSWNDSLRINKISETGEQLNQISHSAPRIIITENDLQKVIKKRAPESGVARRLSIYEKPIGNNEDKIPEFWPAFEWFEIDNQGRIWVAVNIEDRQNYSLRIYGQDGNTKGSTTLPKSVELKEIKNGHAYGIREEDGKQSIFRYKIEDL